MSLWVGQHPKIAARSAGMVRSTSMRSLVIRPSSHRRRPAAVGVVTAPAVRAGTRYLAAASGTPKTAYGAVSPV